LCARLAWMGLGSTRRRRVLASQISSALPVDPEARVLGVVHFCTKMSLTNVCAPNCG
jgi:hypothetical protein